MKPIAKGFCPPSHLWFLRSDESIRDEYSYRQKTDGQA